MYQIWCEVQGRMGIRQAWLKINEMIYKTENKEQSETEAKKLNKIMNKNCNARFHYKAVQI